MPKTIAKALLHRLQRSDGFRQHLQDLQVLSGVECLFLDDLGIESLRYPRSESLPLRRMLRGVPPLHSRHIAVRQALLAGSGMPYTLPWREQLHAIRVEGQDIGYVVLSAWRTADCTEALCRNCWIEFARGGSALPWSVWRKDWLTLPEISPPQFSAWQRLLQLHCQDALRTLDSETGTLPASPQLSPLIRDACRIVQEKYGDPLTLQEVAAGCGVSAEHLSRQFHSVTGLRFRDYLAETRVQAVCRELRATRDPISEIAGRTGFSTLSRFNRTFRTITGRSPRNWRKHPPPE